MNTEKRPVHRDGHILRIRLETEMIRLDVECPHDAIPPGTPWDELPHCRRPYDELGQELRDDQPLTYCNLVEFLTASGDGIETYLDTGQEAEYEVIEAPVPIEYWWAGEWYAWRPVTVQ